jgi:hypothetical protein
VSNGIVRPVRPHCGSAVCRMRRTSARAWSSYRDLWPNSLMLARVAYPFAGHGGRIDGLACIATFTNSVPAQSWLGSMAAPCGQHYVQPDGGKPFSGTAPKIALENQCPRRAPARRGPFRYVEDQAYAPIPKRLMQLGLALSVQPITREPPKSSSLGLFSGG